MTGLSFDADLLLSCGWASPVPTDQELLQAAATLGGTVPANGFYMPIPDVIQQAVGRGHSEAAVRWALWEHIKQGHLDARQGECVGEARISDGGGLELTTRPEVGAVVTALPEFRHWLDGQIGEDQPEGSPEPNRKERRARWVAEAMLLINDHPDWTDKQIAELVGVNPSQLSKKRCPEYQRAKKLARQPKKGPPKGHVAVDPDTGQQDVEAHSHTGADRPELPPAVAEILAKLPEDQQADAYLDASEKAGGQPSAAEMQKVVAAYLAEGEQQ